MTAEPLRRVLEATGYLADGQPAPGVQIGLAASSPRRGREFTPDASWRGPSALTVYFKFADVRPDDRTISTWHREVWNEGFTPLLWVVSPNAVELYNGFSRPRSAEDATHHLLQTFEAVETQLIELDHFAGRFAMETGQFWLRTDRVTRKTSVDEQLLADLAYLERDLLRTGLARPAAQALIGRSIFTQYLVDREIVNAERFALECGESRLPEALRNPVAAQRLFGWLAHVFNGDMFPAVDTSSSLNPTHLSRVANFLEAVDPLTGQTTFFPYRFDVIPVELISSIYEQFAHALDRGNTTSEADQGGDTSPGEARRRGVHYTRLPVVSLILDEVLSGITGAETVLDLTCGSGVFLVEALRRLVATRGGENPSREIIRETLYNQVFGVDISDAAIRVAAFSLYLAALEIDPNPQPPEALRFERLIGRTLLVGDARQIEMTPAGGAMLLADGSRRSFDVIVGNPPWTFRGKEGTDERRTRGPASPRQPRGEGFDFLLRATDFSHSETRYGIVLSAMPFFAGSKTGAAAARHIVEQVGPVTLVNLSSLTKWLFPTASMPAMVLLARHRQQDHRYVTVVNVPWSPSAEKSHTFEIAPSDVSILPLAEWAADPDRLKAAFFGRSRDVALLEDLRTRYADLNTWLAANGSEWRDGLILGKPERRTRDSTHLSGLDLLETKALRPFTLPARMPRFVEQYAQWPRSRETYNAPLLLIKEFLNSGPRPIAAVSERDLVYTDAYFGAALPQSERVAATLVSGILASAVSAWFFLLTAAEFGVFKRRLLTSDVGRFPLPNPTVAVDSEAGARICSLVARFTGLEATEEDWAALDDAVFDLYGFDELDRTVVNDGLIRAGWQWSEGRQAAAAPAETYDDLQPYADSFMASIDSWLQVAGTRHVRAEVFQLPRESALRVVRFVIGNGRRTPAAQVVSPGGELADVLQRIGRRLHVELGRAFVGEREIRVHGADEVVIIKPASRRFWMRGVALEDADAVISESFVGVPT